MQDRSVVLPQPGGAQRHDELAGCDAEVDVGQRDGAAFPLAVVQADVADLEHGPPPARRRYFAAAFTYSSVTYLP